MAIRVDRVPRTVVIAFAAACLVLAGAIALSLLSALVSGGVVESVTRLAEDDQLLSAVWRTLGVFGVSTALQLVLASATTMYLVAVSNWMKLLLVVPYVFGVVAPAFSLLVLLSSAVGPFDMDVLGRSTGAVLVVVLLDTWQWLGVLLVACFITLEQIPRSHFEQAQLEGIGRSRRWWLIARPALTSLFILYGAIRLLDWVRKADVIRALFGEGGPGYATETLGIYVIRVFYWSGAEGYSALLSLLQIGVLALLLSFVYRSAPVRALSAAE